MGAHRSAGDRLSSGRWHGMVSRHHAASVSSASIRALLAAKSALRTLRHARDGMRTASAAGSKTLDHHRLLRTTIAEQAGNAIWVRIVGELFDERHGPTASALRDRFETPAVWILAPDEHDAIRARGRKPALRADPDARAARSAEAAPARRRPPGIARTAEPARFRTEVVFLVSAYH